MKDLPEIILASSSPQRARILQELDIPFTVVSKDVDEITGSSPVETVMYNARLKAETVAGLVASDRLVLAADTVLARGGEIFGKPHNVMEAKSFLRSFSGETVKACSGVAIVHKKSGSGLLCSESAEIAFRQFSSEVIDWYVATGEPLTRAGAFAVSKKGEILVDSIHGSYSCIAGLPKFSILSLLSLCLEKIGVLPSESLLFPDPNELPDDILRFKI